MTQRAPDPRGYLHGHAPGEPDRLRRQARFLAPIVMHDRLPFDGCARLLEIGCGVGAQTELLLDAFPGAHVHGVDVSPSNVEEARRYLARLPGVRGRFTVTLMHAEALAFEPGSFDGAFLCWVLEHVNDPLRCLREAARVLAPGAPIACIEVFNATHYLLPASPCTLRFWSAYNELQRSLGGDPDMGGKLGNLLLEAGFRDVTTRHHVIHLDDRAPEARAAMIRYWRELLMTAAPALLADGAVPQDVVDGMAAELDRLADARGTVFFYVPVHALARAPGASHP